MKITLLKNENRNQLTCVRPDGSYVTANLGPSLPQHDLAHYVVEKQFQLKNGFFGNIERGYSVAELSDKEALKSLDHEVWTAEVLARALQTLFSGACTLDQFAPLVNAELAHWSSARLDHISSITLNAALQEFRGLVESYRALACGEALELHFNATQVA
jgi:hypothetical protein